MHLFFLAIFMTTFLVIQKALSFQSIKRRMYGLKFSFYYGVQWNSSIVTSTRSQFRFHPSTFDWPTSHCCEHNMPHYYDLVCNRTILQKVIHQARVGMGWLWVPVFIGSLNLLMAYRSLYTCSGEKRWQEVSIVTRLNVTRLAQSGSQPRRSGPLKTLFTSDIKVTLGSRIDGKGYFLNSGSVFAKEDHSQNLVGSTLSPDILLSGTRPIASISNAGIETTT